MPKKMRLSVFPSAEAKATKAGEAKGEVDLQILSQADLNNLLLMHTKAQLARTQVELALTHRALLRARHQLEVGRLAEQARVAEAEASKRVDAAKVAADDAEGNYLQVTTFAAAKYGVDWRECAYNEVTGEIVPVPKEQ